MSDWFSRRWTGILMLWGAAVFLFVAGLARSIELFFVAAGFLICFPVVWELQNIRREVGRSG